VHVGGRPLHERLFKVYLGAYLSKYVIHVVELHLGASLSKV
jgi:hypothetical protein